MDYVPRRRLAEAANIIALAACNTLETAKNPRRGVLAAQEVIQLDEYCQRTHAELPALLVGALLAFRARARGGAFYPRWTQTWI